VLHRFLDHWENNLDGELHSVRVAAAEVIMPPRFRAVGASLALN